MSFNIEFMEKVKLISAEEYRILSEQYVIVGKELTNLIKSIAKTKKFTRN